MTQFVEEKEFYTIKEFAKVYGLCTNTIENWIHKDKLKVILIGDRYRIPNSERIRLSKEYKYSEKGAE